MTFFSLSQKIKKVRSSIVAIGIKLGDKVSILGSGFAVSDDGKILSAAHVFNQVPQEQIQNLAAMAMVERQENGLERYTWLPISLIKKDEVNDLVLFQAADYKIALLKKLELGDSDKIEVGDDVYFIGFPYAAQLINDGFGITLVVNKAIISNIKQDGKDQAHKRNFIILDAISNPGNSGCPLINLETNKVIGVMTISFRIKSQVQQNLDIREPMHICAGKPINLAKSLYADF